MIKKIKEWITDYCQDFSPEGALANPDCNAKPTLKLFLYNVYRKFRGWSPIFQLRMFFQKVTRLNHISDSDLWECHATMARKILPVLYAFRKMERQGHPTFYSDYDKNSGWQSEDDYTKALENGDVHGGGMTAWDKDIDHIIHSLEYLAWEGSKKLDKWYIDNFGMDPYSDDARNKYKYYTYKIPNGMHGMTFDKKPENEEYTELEEHETYGNHELLRYIDEYVSNGLLKLGKMFQAFWD
jgi:hypothetical protein